jgi:hypothetical protein
MEAAWQKHACSCCAVGEKSLPWAFLGALSLSIAGGCAHGDVTCTHRVSPVNARRQSTIDANTATYAEAMSALRQGETGKAATRFYWIVAAVNSSRPGTFLFEKLDDGSWSYRCDDATRLFALAAYRLGSIQASDPQQRDRASDNFCLALQSRPDIVLRTATAEGMAPAARVLFDQVKSGPHPILGQCYVESGVRYDSRPVNGVIERDNEAIPAR